jgi:phosphomannomutase
MATDVRAKEYICPGETHPISRAVHLSRLAVNFTSCERCPLRFDAPAVPLKTTAEAPDVRSLADATSPRGVFTSEGVRGVYLNEMTRTLADKLGAAFGVLLWQDAALGGRNDGIDRGTRLVAPVVIVGYDERPFSPALFTDVTAGLRRMGCGVIDIARTTRPCLDFAVHHARTSGGVLITGSGCEPSWGGLDFVRAGATPVSMGTGLERLRDLMEETLSRPTRKAGTHRTFPARDAYRAWLVNHFHIERLRPLTIVCAAASTMVRQEIEHLFQSLPCRLLAVEFAVRARNPVHRRDTDMLRLSAAVRENHADLGILIDDDGQRCGFIDERGRHVSPAAITRFLVPTLLADRPSARVLVEAAAMSGMRSLVTAFGGECERCPPTTAEIAVRMGERKTVYAGGESGRHWFGENFPTCDAIVTLAKVLAATSQANVSFSDLAAG